MEVSLNVLQYIKHPSMFIGTWSTLLVLEDEFELAEKNQLTTLPRLGREWIVSHDLNPTMYSQSRRTSSIHLKGSDQYESRTPAIFSELKGEMSICSAISGNWDECVSLSGPPESTWTSVNISQEWRGGKFLFRIHIDGQEEQPGHRVH